MILLNPKYAHLRPHFEHIEDLMMHGTMIHMGRNRLCTIEIDGITICIKDRLELLGKINFDVLLNLLKNSDKALTVYEIQDFLGVNTVEGTAEVHPCPLVQIYVLGSEELVLL